MMGRQSRQVEIAIVDLGEMVPEGHLLKKIASVVDFDFIYERAESLYSPQGRPSVDPVLLVKMLLVGYLYGIGSERRLEQEVHLNLAYRWFCGLGLNGRVPDHSTFSQNRRRRFGESNLFESIFLEIVGKCLEKGLIDGELVACDGTYISSHGSWDSVETRKVTVQRGAKSYLDALDEELAREPGYEPPRSESVEVEQRRSRTDPEAAIFSHGEKSGLGYLMETSVDCRHGLITGMDVYPANAKESSIVLRHLERQIEREIPIHRVVLDKGYDVGAVHRGLELLGIEGYISSVDFSNPAEQNGMTYLPEEDCFLCPQNRKLTFQRVRPENRTGKALRYYAAETASCENCPDRNRCLGTKRRLWQRQIVTSGFYPAFHRGRKRMREPQAKECMRQRKIWAEGCFALMKREHNLQRIRKVGLARAREECLLACIAVNLKRMVAALVGPHPHFRKLQLFLCHLRSAPRLDSLAFDFAF